MKKRFLFLLTLILITGCSVKYDVLIDEDLKVYETAEIIGGENLYKQYYKTSKVNVLKELLLGYEDVLKDNSYSYELKETDNPYVILNKEYNNLSSYLNDSQLFNDYFDKINYNKSDNIIKIETEGFNPNEEDNPDRFYVENIDISITSKYEVINSNASKVDENTNTYHFVMDKETEDFKIMLEIDTSKIFNPNKNKILMIIIAAGVLIASWIIVFVVNKKKKI